jgi:hypothetical protein
VAKFRKGHSAHVYQCRRLMSRLSVKDDILWYAINVGLSLKPPIAKRGRGHPGTGNPVACSACSSIRGVGTIVSLQSVRSCLSLAPGGAKMISFLSPLCTTQHTDGHHV